MDAEEKERQAEEMPTIEVAEIVRMGTDRVIDVIPLKRMKPKPEKAKLAEWLRKVTITIDDKNDNEPISVVFEGDWSGRDLNLASKSLLLEYGVYVRNR